ncbi:MAG: DegV family protein [Clostridiales bacterium]|nr:DegV family protein [Clostridiales bacterium]
MYKILVDSGCDLGMEFLRENDIDLITLSYFLDGVEHVDDGVDKEAIKVLYDAMREGKSTSTSQPLQENIYQSFVKYAKQGVPVVYVTLSSGISGTYGSACIARNQCIEEYPDAKVEVVDSLSACGGYGLLVRRALEEKNNGMDFDSLVAWLNEKRHQLAHWFTVDDLEYLQRGGRVSKTVAVVGGVLKLKPVMRVDEEGHLVSAGIARGRKNALKELITNIIDGCNAYIDTDYKQTICINHADCLEEALMCKKLLMENEKTSNVIVDNVGPTIGCHSGPGTMAIFCFANSRMKQKA